MRGRHTYPGGVLGCSGPAGSVPPKLDYSHSIGCAVIGGYIYRGPIGPLRGQYLFSDSCSGDIYVVADVGAGGSPWTYQTLAGTPAMSTYSFGEDAQATSPSPTAEGLRVPLRQQHRHHFPGRLRRLTALQEPMRATDTDSAW
jgi:hypothetical protein